MFVKALAVTALATTTAAFPYRQYTRDSSPPNQTYGATPADPEASLPLCGPETVTCRCPEGSFYQQSSSFAFWPVPAKDITEITANLFHTGWFGTEPEKTTGNGTEPGAVRYLSAELPGGKNIEVIQERLTELNFTADGGYYMKFQMNDAPMYYEKKEGPDGLLAGSWDIIDVRDINGTAYMLWDIHVCFSDLYGEFAFS